MHFSYGYCKRKKNNNGAKFPAISLARFFHQRVPEHPVTIYDNSVAGDRPGDAHDLTHVIPLFPALHGSWVIITLSRSLVMDA